MLDFILLGSVNGLLYSEAIFSATGTHWSSCSLALGFTSLSRITDIYGNLGLAHEYIGQKPEALQLPQIYLYGFIMPRYSQVSIFSCETTSPVKERDLRDRTIA